MKKAKMIYGVGLPLFSYQIDGYDKFFYDFNDSYDRLQILLKILPLPTKVDVLNLFEYEILDFFNDYFARVETDEIIWNYYNQEDIFKANPTLLENDPRPTYSSEYINVIGQLFLDGMIDFLCDCDDDYKRIDYPTNLSYFGNSKYEAWKHFRDNFFYKNAFRNIDGDNIFASTSWDKPQNWSQYNILVARTPKGEKYFNEILAPKFYEKYKDIEIMLDDYGNII